MRPNRRSQRLPGPTRTFPREVRAAVQLWDMAAKPIRQFERHQQTVASVAFSPDNRFLLSGSVDGTVRLWDVNAGKELRQYPGHEGGGTCVDFSPDSRYVLSSGNDALVRLWDQETGVSGTWRVGKNWGDSRDTRQRSKA